ncbi:MAG: Gfo/Idh/MocA family oxidoreductase [Candidatus Hydrogenedentes bacterium]|nr:Gfo/Idh/MocA family oxidoreductase [Candidatus Hydrogenedentota bacterium]
MRSIYSRRSFLKRATAVATAPMIVPSYVLGGEAAPSERVRVGCIGVGDRGSYIMGATLEQVNAQVVAVCDVKRDRREAAQATVNKTYGNSDCAAYNEFEELVARDDIDAVTVGSCDHWHVLHALAAVRSGKDVYVEKPLGLTVEQDQVLRAEVRKHKRMFQFGTQQRSDEKFRRACELVRNGRIGKLHTINVWSPASVAGGPTELAPVPETLDYDRWLGPAPAVPYTKERETNKWWWFISDYALGFIAGWGIHPMDIALWGAGSMAKSPVTVEGTGTFPTEGVCNTATDWKVMMTYDSGLKIDYRAQPAAPEWAQRYGEVAEHGTAFEGSDGWVIVDRRHIKTFPEDLAKRESGGGDIMLYKSDHHIANFIECVRSRKDPVSNIEDSVQGDIACHISDIAIRLQRKLRWDTLREAFIDDAEANARLTRVMREPWHL